jgi:ADP-ribosylglycohydrolase
MIGAIAGDIIGSVYEFHPIKTKEFPLFSPKCRFTDDSVLTIAVAKAILEGSSYREAVLSFGRRYPDAGYGGRFIGWLASPDPQPYKSFGNGSAMRVSPIGFAFDTVEEVLREAWATAVISHDHPEGIKGAEATALAVFLARKGRSKKEISQEIAGRFGYDLDRTLDEIRPAYSFDETCQGTVPEAIISFLESDSWENTVRNAVSLGGDADTLACIAGGIAEAFYGPSPATVIAEVRRSLTRELWEICEEFQTKYGIGGKGRSGRKNRQEKL